MASFDSINGGIAICIQHFSKFLIMSGLDEFYRMASEKASHHSMEKSLCDDWILLKSGIKSKEKELRIIIEFIREKASSIENLLQEDQSINKSIKSNNKEWEDLANQAKEHLLVLKKQAIDAQIELIKELGFDSEPIRFQASFLFLGVGLCLQSHQKLQEDLLFLKQVLNFDPSQGSTTKLFNDLIFFQKKISQLENKKTEIFNKLQTEETYCNCKAKELTDILWKLSTHEQWALFRICYHQK